MKLLTKPPIHIQTLVVFLFTLCVGASPLFAQNVTVSEVRVYDDPPNEEDTYGADDEIRARVRFSAPVIVTGDPRLQLRIGDRLRSAEIFIAGRDVFLFRYFVAASDRDDDGVSVPANALQLNGGSIKDTDGRDADLTHDPILDDPERKVNGRLDIVPAIRSVSLIHPTSKDYTYGRNETIRLRVFFSERVYVTGAPQLAIQVGTQTRQADIHSWRGSDLDFEYVVQSSDFDTDGVSVPADALTLNGGTIRDADGNDADLTSDAQPARPEFKVNGGSGGGPPTVLAPPIFIRLPANQDTYAVGETIFAYLIFSRSVQVIGTPQLAIQVGERTRQAEHIELLRTGEMMAVGNRWHLPADRTTNVYFQYVVQPSDVDDDGISVPADAVTLNGGSILAVNDDTDAQLSHDGRPDDPLRKVDGSHEDDRAPVFEDLTVHEPVRGVFGHDDVILVQLGQSEGVTVTGRPRVALRIGARTRFATFQEKFASTSLLFEYVVNESDRDDDGLSIAADAVELNGGTIRDNAGHDANLDLRYLAFDNNPNYRVDGRLTAMPDPVDSATDRAVLEALYDATGGANWRRNTNWKTDAPLSEWEGVQANEDNRVWALRLVDNNLAGPIPRELGSLTHLRTIELQDNNLTGEIPRELGSLTNLEFVNLQRNNLTGEIPRGLGGLDRLVALNLHGNDLTGGIPHELGSLASLGQLNLNNNNLTGGIPRELGGLANLGALRLHNNNLTGGIPRELGSLTGLRDLRLHDNNLTGEIPRELARFESTINPQQNGVILPIEGEGTVAPVDSAADKAVLEAFFDATGGANWNNSTNWKTDRPLSEWFGVTAGASVAGQDGTAENRVTGLSLADNNLTGQIPRELADLPQLATLVLNGNNLTGTIPEELRRFENTINPQQGGVNLPVGTPVPALPFAAVLLLGGGLWYMGRRRIRTGR